MPLDVRISSGYDVSPGGPGQQVPIYEAPGAFTGSIADTVLTVSAISSGYLSAEQTLDAAGVITGTKIVSQTNGTPGGMGVYAIDKPQTLSSRGFTTSFILFGNVQPLSWKDLQHVDALNLQGTLVKIYLYGTIDAIIRKVKKGGDLIVAPDGKTYLVTSVFEQWGTWCAVLATLQNG